MKPETRINKFQKKIKDLKIGDKNFDLIADIINVEEPAEKFQKLMIKDDTGEIKLTLFGKDINRFKEKEKVKIYKGYISEYNGEISINVSKFNGEISKL